MSFELDEGKFSASRVSLTAEDDAMTLELNGEVRIEMTEGIIATCDHLKLNERLTLKGDVDIQFGNSKFEAEKATLNFDTESFVLHGVAKASLTVSKDEVNSFVGDKIEVNLPEETLAIDNSAQQIPFVIEYQEEGEALPSAYYLEDDIQYFPQGPEFRLETDPTSANKAWVKEANQRNQSLKKDRENARKKAIEAESQSSKSKQLPTKK